MIKIIYWTLLPKIVSLLSKGSNKCLNICAGFVCGAAQAAGVEIFTKDSVNEALSLKSAADACKGELPIQLTTEHGEVFEIMKEGGATAILKAKSVMKSSGVDEKCIEIFGLVCAKAQAFGALEIIKEACANLWV
jgi:hypothetical protein